MEPQELSQALLVPQVTVVANLGDLLDTLPRLDTTQLRSLKHLYSKLEDFSRELWATMASIDGSWLHRDVTSDIKAPPVSLSRALAAYKSTPWTSQDHVTVVVWHWQGSLKGHGDIWAELARAASELRNTCRKVAVEAAGRARHLRKMAAHYERAREKMVELGQALGREEEAKAVAGHEARVKREARVAATKERQQMNMALGLLELLVAACDKATMSHRELERRVGDTETTLEGAEEKSPDVLEDLETKAAEAERLWEAIAHLAKGHLVGTLGDIIKFYFTAAPAGPSARKVIKRRQRAIKDIPRLLRSLERPQSIPRVSPVSMEPQKLCLVLLKLKPQVTVMATLGKLVGITARQDVLLPLCQPSLHQALENFAKNLHEPLHNIAKPFWHRCGNSVLADALTSLSQALAAYENTSWTTWEQVRSVASEWHESVSTLEGSWAQLSREAAKLRDACRDAANGRGIAAAMEEFLKRVIEEALAGVVREGVIIDVGEDVEEDVGRAVVGESQARAVRRMREQAEEALGLLKHLAIACARTRAFYRELRRVVGEMADAIVRGTGEPRRDFRTALAAKVTKAEGQWVTSSLLARDHLVEALEDIHTIFRRGDPDGSIACGVTERCQRAAEDIPNLLQGQ